MRKAKGCPFLFAFIVIFGVVLLSRGRSESRTPVPKTGPMPAPSAPASMRASSGQAATALVVAAVGPGLASERDSTVLAADGRQSIAPFAGWLERFKELKERGNSLSPSVLEEGRRFAESRRMLMERLIREEPRQALDQSFCWRDWTALPREIQALVEEPFSEEADFDVIIDDRPTSEGQECSQTHRLAMRGTGFHVSVYGRWHGMTSKTGIPVQGVILGNQVALWESPVMQLDGEDLAVVQQQYPEGNPRGQSWLTGQSISGEGVAALIGGRIYYFASEGEMATVAQTIAEGERKIGPRTVQLALVAAASSGVFDVQAFLPAAVKAQSAWTESPKRVLGMRLDYTPPLGTPFTHDQFISRLVQASEAMDTISYSKTRLVPTVTNQVLILPNSKEYYAQNPAPPNDFTTVARKLAAAAGYASTDYDIFVESVPGDFGGYASIGGDGMHLSGSVGPDLMVHEFGHNYGVGHANYWRDSTGTGLLGHFLNPDGTAIEHFEYLDDYDVMAWSSWDGPWTGRHMNVNLKATLNWIEPQEIITARSDGVYRIYRFDHPAARTARNAKLGLRVQNRDGEEFWVGLREAPSPTPVMLRQSAVIVWTPCGPSWHRLIDTRPLSAPNGSFDEERKDSPLPPGQAWTDPTGSLRIENLGGGGTSPFDYLDLEVMHFASQPPIELYTSSAATTAGLTASFVDKSLRSVASPGDWRESQTIVGTRVDPNLIFPSNSWGTRASVGLTHGTDADWADFSVQWDGYVLVNRPVRLATKSDDGSRMWIDLNGDGVFSPSGREFINNHWGSVQGTTVGPSSSTLQPGMYQIRIQYEEGWGDNRFGLISSPVVFEFSTDGALTSAGLIASYVDQSLRQDTEQDDWRVTQEIAGTRLEPYPYLNAGGNRAAVGLTHGTDADWDNFSAQWDGYLHVHEPAVFATVSDDGSRMWIDFDGNGIFSASGPEFINNNWGNGQGAAYGLNSTVIAPGTYRIRMQYEESMGANSFMLGGSPPWLSSGGTLGWPMGATVLTFDDTGANANPSAVPAGYGGLSWSGSFCVFNAPAGSDGYEAGRVSSDYVVYNDGGNPVEVSGSPFDFVGAHFTAANQDKLSIVIEGYRSGVRVYGQTVVVNRQYPTWIWLGYEGVDRVTFKTPIQGLGYEFVMDNMVIRRSPVVPTGATVLTFDDTGASGNPSAMPAGYGGLSWSGSFAVYNAPAGSNTGYETGRISADYVAYSDGGNPVEVSGSPFDFVGAHFTAANQDKLSIVIEGYRSGVRAYSQTVTVNRHYPTWIWLGYEGVDRVTFKTPIQGLGYQFVMDNMVIRRSPVVPTGATVLTFDNTGAGDNPSTMPAGYGDLSWSGSFAVYNAPAGSNAGYETGRISADYVAYSDGGNPVAVSGSPFDFIGAHFTAAHEDRLSIVIEGFRSGVRVYGQMVVVNRQHPTWIWLGYEGVDRVTFKTPIQGLGYQFVMDNMVIKQ